MIQSPSVDVLLLSTLVVAVRCASLPIVHLGRDAWLEDFETFARQIDGDSAWMQADSPVSGSKRHDKKTTASTDNDDDDDDETPRCPSPPAITSRSCSLPPPADLIQCQSDNECSSFSGRKCCFDGCRYACLVAIAPPPYIDWKYEPRVRFASGNSWLIRDSEEESEVDWCSTSQDYHDDEDPLLCPHGYICQVDEDVDVAENGVPNRGRCVRQPLYLSSDEEHPVLRLPDSRASGGMCVISSDQVYSDGDTFIRPTHVQMRRWCSDVRRRQEIRHDSPYKLTTCIA